MPRTHRFLEAKAQEQAVSQFFLDYCVESSRALEHKHLAPLISTIADALVKDSHAANAMRLGVKTVQIYLRVPPIELYGQTLIRLHYLDPESIEEMMTIKPADMVLGTFLMEQSLVSKEQRDYAVIAQHRLMSIQEVHNFH